MARYVYDESGVTFYYFALTLLVLVLIPSTFYFVKNKDATKAEQPRTIKVVSISKKVPPRSKRGISIVLILGWIAVLGLGYFVKNVKIETASKWDPYDILDLDHGAKEKDIKRKFKRLSLKWHPDKVSSENREVAEKQYVEVVKAYKTLTDKEARENYEKYGHPDGIQSTTMGIALPKLLVEGKMSPLVMAVYMFVFGFVLPFYVGRWWYTTSKFTKDGIRKPTMETFFKNIREPMSQRNLLELLTAAQEFDEGELRATPDDAEALKALEMYVRAAVQSYSSEAFVRSTKFSSDSAWKATLLIFAHLEGIQIEDPRIAHQQQQMLNTAIRLVQRGLLQIAIVQNWSSCARLLMNLSQNLVQGVYEHDAPVLQLPFMSRPFYASLRMNHGVYGVSPLLKLDSQKQAEILAPLSPPNIKVLISAARMVPRPRIAKQLLTVVGDAIITPYSIVSLIVYLELDNHAAKPDHDPKLDAICKQFMSVDSGDVEGIENLVTTIASLRDGPGEAPETVAPRLAAKKTSCWWVVLENPQNSRLVVPPTRLINWSSKKILLIQFQAPATASSYAFRMSLISDSYTGCDLHFPIKMEVVDSKMLPPEPVIEDDISEPDENSLAAQMAQARSGSQQRTADDDTSSDED